MNNLQIFDIELKDYRQYKGTVRIDLKIDGDQHINIIEGQNGAGKSNLLNAITLCFYNEETHLETQEEQGLESDPLVNKRRLDEINEGESASGYVEVTLGKDEPKYIFTREFRTAKREDGDFSDATGDLRLRQKFQQDWRDVPNPHTRLSEILPTRVHEYFLFDGEQLDDFFDKRYTDRVESAILDVSHIELLNRSLDHIDTVRTELERTSTEYEGEAKRKREKYEEAEDKLEDLESREEEYERDIRDANDRLDEIDEKLAGSSDPEVQRKLERRENLNDRLDEKRDDLVEKRAEVAENFAEAGALIYNEDALRFTLEQLEELENQGQLPPKIQDWFLDQLLDRGECICGAELEDDEEKREHLEELRKEVAVITEGNIEGKIEIPHLLSQADDSLNALLQGVGDITGIEDDIEGIERQLRDISKELEGKEIPEDVDVAQLEQQRSEIEERIRQMREEVGQLRGEIEQQEQKVKDRRQAWQEELEKEEKYEVLAKKISFIDDSEEEMQEIRAEILKEVRNETEEYLNQYFNDLIWKDENYDVELTDEYQVKVFGPSGEKKLGSLSAGERQVLALSFMSALSKISGFSAPLVIDTPLGRISSRPKRRIAQNLPDYLQDTQITFLMTDEEYSQEVQAMLKPSIAHEYRLNYEKDVTQVNDR
ncbi:chromosome segregation protein [Halopiger aswanensis]|uniref:DNA sulfur modification protein DndD n=1 Tax=Halopiger aswanensis TaxID=148449 RepID=A0A419WJJ2_9EURY|nr:chromosome segregation protein [Halopiger aswanensis]RKD95611.1 DNA sulfur modification protein DndD [Halopiger aswanensis]